MASTSSGYEGIRALLFDLGGVHIDIDFRRAFQAWAALADCDAVVLEERFSFDDHYERHERGELSSAGYFSVLRDRLGIKLSNRELADGWNSIYIGVVPGMSAMLNRASHRFPLFAMTNSNPTHQSVWAEQFADDLAIFEDIFVSSEIGLRKPDAEAYLWVTRRIGVEPHQILFFDDIPENCKGALAMGMPSVLVSSITDVEGALCRLDLAI